LPSRIPAYTIALLLLFPVAYPPQVSRADFEQALKKNANLPQAAGMMPGIAHWINESSKLWFEENDGTTHRYTIYDARTQQRSILDNARIADAISKKLPKPIAADHLTLSRLRFDAKATGFTFSTQHGDWHCTCPRISARQKEATPNEDDGHAPGFEGNDVNRPVLSPDGRWEATIQNFKRLSACRRRHGTCPAAEHRWKRRRLLPAEFAGMVAGLAPSALARRVLQGMRRQVPLCRVLSCRTDSADRFRAFYPSPATCSIANSPCSSIPSLGASRSSQPISSPIPMS